MLDRLLGHDEWTTGELLRRSTELTDQQLHQQVDAGWESIQVMLVHMIGNVRVWTDLMNGNDTTHSTEGWDDYDVPSLTAVYQAAYRDFARLARGIRDKQRWNDTWLDVLDKPPRSKTYGGAILHVITHNMHHRSELLHMLKRLGLDDLPEGDLLGWEETQVAVKGSQN